MHLTRLFPQHCPLKQPPEQHCFELVHAPPGGLQVAHTWAWQVMPEQQSPPEHVSPALPQHLPPTHPPEQQSAPLAQAASFAAHCLRWHCPPWHDMPEQQGELAEHAAPSALHAQTPLSQARSAQQSALLAHDCPFCVQVQAPDAQWKPAQQSELFVQLAASPPHATQALPLHSNPLQQSGPDVALHASPALLHFETHNLVSMSHWKPEQQSLSTLQWALPSPQAVAQTPLSSSHPSLAQQLLEVAQGWPAARQCVGPPTPPAPPEPLTPPEPAVPAS